MTEAKRFSLLYPKEYNFENNSFIHNPDIIKQLGADTLLFSRNTDFFAFLTDDCDVIDYRQSIFSDMANIPELSELIDKSAMMLKDIDEMRRIKEKNYTSDRSCFPLKRSKYISA